MTKPYFIVFYDFRHIISLWSQLIFILVTFSSLMSQSNDDFF